MLWGVPFALGSSVLWTGRTVYRSWIVIDAKRRNARQLQAVLSYRVSNRRSFRVGITHLLGQGLLIEPVVGDHHLQLGTVQTISSHSVPGLHQNPVSAHAGIGASKLTNFPCAGSVNVNCHA